MRINEICKPRKHEVQEISKILSTKKENSIQITSGMPCPVNCEYCPQETLRENKGSRKNNLDLKDFKQYLKNIPQDTIIRWTGYSEPLLAKDFPEMVLHAEKRGYKQVLSTTLVVHKRCLKFLGHYKNFRHINIHVQDIDCRMKGLNVDSEYVDNFKNILTCHGEISRKRQPR